MKRKLSRIFIALLITLNVIGASSTFAADVKEIAVANKSGDISTRAEETGWVYREYNGWYQKRLWSYTYGKWLTDWINTFPVEQ